MPGVIAHLGFQEKKKNLNQLQAFKNQEPVCNISGPWPSLRPWTPWWPWSHSWTAAAYWGLVGAAPLYVRGTQTPKVSVGFICGFPAWFKRCVGLTTVRFRGNWDNSPQKSISFELSISCFAKTKFAVSDSGNMPISFPPYPSCWPCSQLPKTKASGSL